jgi:hypothetical protein
MAEFYAEAELDITPWEYVKECSSREIELLIKEIQEQQEEIWEAEVNKYKTEFKAPDTSSLATNEFFEAMQTISKNHLRLSLEQEEQILNIAKTL